MIKSQRLDNLTDVQYEPLYDAAVLKATVDYKSHTVRLFSIPQGQELVAGGALKTPADTNMKTASQLPSPEAFRCYGLRFEAIGSGLEHADILQKLAKDASIVLKVGNKPYFTAPLEEVMQGIETLALGLDPAANLGGGAGEGLVRLQAGKPAHHGYRLPADKFIDIASTENFSVEIKIETAALTPTADFYFRVYLLGLRGKDVR